MNGTFSKPGKAAAYFFLLAVAPALAQQGHESTPQNGVLLLRNGQVIEGQIDCAGGVYSVAVPNGEIRVKAEDVQFSCRDLEEGYLRKRASIHVGNVTDHLGLTHWCLRYGLVGHAVSELADAMAADPSHPAIPMFQRRLQFALTPPKNEATAATTSPSHSPTDQGKESEELDKMVRQLPPGTVEVFTQSIQPLLVNNCSSASCHGSQSRSAFQLQRSAKGEPPTRRQTQKNLQAALKCIDRANPVASRLLTVPIEPHGTAHDAVFDQTRLQQYKLLVDWVCRVGSVPPADAPTAAPEAAASPATAPATKPAQQTAVETRAPRIPAQVNAITAAPQAGPVPQANSAPKPLPPDAGQGRPLAAEASSEPKVTPATYLESVADRAEAAQTVAPACPFDQPAPPKDPDSVLPIRPKVQRGAKIEQFVPADPFDPAIFNRRYFGEEKKPSPAGGEKQPSPCKQKS